MWKKSVDAALSEIELSVLVAVKRLGDEAYGLRIRDDIASRSGQSLSLSNVYATLTRLEERGVVRSTMGDPSPERGGRRKRLYAVTAAGKTAIAANYRAFKALVADLEASFKP